MSLEKRSATNLKCSQELLRNDPLHERVPTHDEEGNALGDFMMLFPGLRDLAEVKLRSKVCSSRGPGQKKIIVWTDRARCRVSLFHLGIRVIKTIAVTYRLPCNYT
jgi:hypothetical protein